MKVQPCDRESCWQKYQCNNSMSLAQKCFNKKDIYLEPEFLMLHQEVISAQILHKKLLLCPQRLRSEKEKSKELIQFLREQL